MSNAKKLLLSLIESRRETFEEMEKVTAKAVEESRSLNEEESKRFKELNQRFAKLDADIIDIEKVAAFEERQNQPVDQPLDRNRTADPAAAFRKEERGYKLGELLVDIVRHKRTGRKPDRLQHYEQRQNEMYERQAKLYGESRALSSYNPEEGGWLVGQDEATDLVQRGFDEAVFASRCMKVTLGGNSNGLRLLKLKGNSRVDGSRYGGIRVYWVGEGEAPPKSNPTFEPLDIRLNKIMALVQAPSELLDDATGLESWIRSEFPREFAFQLDDALFDGDGRGKPLGIMNSGVLMTAPKGVDQLAETYTFENFVYQEDLLQTMGEAEMFINRNVKSQLRLMDRTVGAGGVPVFEPKTSASAMRFAGYTPIVSEHCESVGTKGDVLLADWLSYYLIDKTEVRFDSSMHVAFETDEQVFRFVRRVGGQPRDKEPLTPYKGRSNDKYSPFVVVETRNS
jgi:HK97 family phage major capsid protein